MLLDPKYNKIIVKLRINISSKSDSNNLNKMVKKGGLI